MRDMQETINLICTLYGKEFRGKKGGRYSLTRTQLRQILDVPRLHARYITQLQDSLQKKGFVLIDMDFGFSTLPLTPLKNMRKPPQDLINQLTGTVLEELSEPDDDMEEGE